MLELMIIEIMEVLVTMTKIITVITKIMNYKRNSMKKLIR